jgi:hypothetical protein
MNCRRIAALLVLLSLLWIPARAGDAKSSGQFSQGQLTKAERIEIIRGLNAELIYVRIPFPMGQKGVAVKEGAIVFPSEQELQQLLADNGPAARPGDRAQITNVEFKGSTIHFEINGGPRKKTKWYQRIQVGGMGGTVPLSPSDPSANPRGSFVDLRFDRHIPELTPEQVKQMLSPVFDFNAKSAAEAYLATVPPKVRDAIQHHQVLVGMDREMVNYSKGRPQKKIREKDGTVQYEEWIYGEPPKDVEFVRLVGDEVIRVETMRVDGEKVIRTQKEVDVKSRPTVAQSQPPTSDTTTTKPRRGAPTLRRPGEPVPELPKGGIDPGDTPRTDSQTQVPQ